MSSLPLIVDCDNALGSSRGDVDDAFALVSILKSSLQVRGIGCTHGNAPAPEVLRNNRALCALFPSPPPVWNSIEVVDRLVAIAEPFRFASLGPLTHFARALSRRPALADFTRELVFVGTNYGVPLPAFSFIDFNQANDRAAFRQVVKAEVPLTLFPLNVARRLRLTLAQLRAREAPPNGVLDANGSERWFRRARWLKASLSIPVWDLGAALYLEAPELFMLRSTGLNVGRFGQCDFSDRHPRRVKVITGFDAQKSWELFFAKF